MNTLDTPLLTQKQMTVPSKVNLEQKMPWVEIHTKHLIQNRVRNE
jgi:hypothetical protein